ncbi:MAG: Mrp/NBP35 family ATP-binding protein [Zestosphaera sp.]
MNALRHLIDDPRKILVEERLKNVSNVVPVMSPKGGVGKTVISALIALAMAESNYSVGLLDLDVTNPSIHVVLNLGLDEKPLENKGVIPPETQGVRVMSVAYYTEGRPLPLRGSEVTEVVREVLAITIWGNLDYLIIDTPPGMSDVHMEIINNIRKAKPLVVTTPHVLSVSPVKSLLKMLKEVGSPIIGLVENMSENPTDLVMSLCREFRVKYLGNVPLDSLLAFSVGNASIIKKTKAYSKVAEIIKYLRPN